METFAVSGALQPLKPSTTLKRYFIGFSTQAGRGPRSLYDIELINVDLANAFNTRVGERVMRPEYGCKLWDYVMEPMTPGLRDRIVAEAERICSLDSRLVLQDTAVFQFDAGFSVNCTLAYLPWQVVSTFAASFANAEAAYFTGGALT